MTPAVFMLAVFGIAFGAGGLGALLGIGGGVIVVPALTLLLEVDIRYAIGASIVSVIATSSGAGAAYVKEQFVNIRVAMFLELATTWGAIAGAVVAGAVAGRWLHGCFAAMLLYAVFAMWRHANADATRVRRPHPWADAFRLHGELPIEGRPEHEPYEVRRGRLGFALSLLAGAVSGLLGVGGGVIKVPVMTAAMGMPLKAATATSNFMIGVTAAASAAVFFARGDIDPYIAAPTALGVLAGAMLAAGLMGRVPAVVLRVTFTIVAVIVAVQMLRKAG